MSFLARFKVITKILAVIMLLSAVAITMSWLGIHTMASLNAGADNMSAAAQRAHEREAADAVKAEALRNENKTQVAPSLAYQVKESGPEYDGSAVYVAVPSVFTTSARMPLPPLPTATGRGRYFGAFANFRFRRSSTTWYSAESSV